MQPTVKLIVSPETVDKQKEVLKQRLDELKLDYEITDADIAYKEITVKLNISKLKMIKHLFKLVGAPDEEIKYLCVENCPNKSIVKSVIFATANDILNNIVKSVRI